MNKPNLFNELFIFEMANNHMGDVEHGKAIIRRLAEIKTEFSFQFGFKLQYRDLDTFIHPDYKERQDIKYIKRFSETRLSKEQLQSLKDEITRCGFIAICTPFDENSVDLIEEHDFDVIKIGSCSFTDWPLLERIIQTDKPIIASTAGALLTDIDKVVSFFEHRQKEFALMHCVGAYPTPNKDLELNQIDLFRTRYPAIPIGFSTHEEPDNFDPVKMAVAKGARLFERHVGIANDKYQINAYSSNPEQVCQWLQAAREAYDTCGVAGKRRSISVKEETDLRGLRRGVFAKSSMKKGAKVTTKDIFYAIPNIDSQIVSNELSKYSEYTLKKDIAANELITYNDVNIKALRETVLNIINKVNQVLLASNITLSNQLDLELSHHYGIESYAEYGAAIVNCINREYCKKLIILLPGQKHPVHHHKKKEETFHLLYGDMNVALDGKEKRVKTGEMIVVEREVDHSFSSDSGAVFEEISTTHYPDDSFYQDEKIIANKNRKTAMTYWADWIDKAIK
jgi:sialic acid synthase SpsE/mannose-6-phosphate isomerase-like protein (cupin superfamily)